ncbi:DUF2066 domain-containing protein [Pseudomonas sp. 5P_3.1_Bac2]|uniref:DUF2066 domain-containing protein n=1 Tax=Pseudomonas sp. 5P_3.1_Bac2 TaxID=2971617 RepID=UPI0021C91CE1|nr:DUF2066 domain-containing protein [Pseudomonas sp. 5P_3.1_Bac2]MCU1716752.1 DUF2066 domain-containing protein [Pseudomonas sp. 5P_3.1_Bac2]
MRLPVRLLVVCLSLSSWSAVAAPVSDLYQVREPVSSQQPEERTAALGRALDSLVVRLTGKTDAASNPALAALHKDPQQIVSQFSYVDEQLLVDFDPVSTDRSLRQAGLSLWGANRPALMVWWLNDGSDGSNLIGDAQAAAKPLLAAAQHRGLPLRLPIADLSEQLAADAANLTNDDPSTLRAASERYAADALLAVLAREEGGQWQAQWRLWLGDSREQGTVQGADQAAVADAVMLAVNQKMAPRFIVAAGAASNLQLQVQGANLARYAEIQRVLEPFSARLRSVQGDTLTFAVNASAEQLRAQLGLAHLQEVTEAAVVPASPTVNPTEAVPALPAPTNGNVLRYRW